MPKRKRDDPSPISPATKPSSAPPNRALARQKKLCTIRLETAQKDLLSALRFSAGFERQKFSRRKKTAKENKDEKVTERLEAEYAVLKNLDFPKVADQHLRKTIARVKSIKDHEAIQEWLGEGERGGGEQDSVRLNVLARLYNGAGVKKVVDRVVEDLKGILGAGGVGAKAGKEKEGKKARINRVEEEDEDEEVADISDDDLEAFEVFKARVAAPSSVEGDSDDSLSEGHRPPSIDNSEGDTEDNSDVVIDEDEVSASESESGSDASSSAISFNGLDSAQSDLDALPKPPSKPKPPKEPVSKSTFLPSLSHAAYYSGSESSASDLDAAFAPRKNRRGQKARQKIWEAKYGDKAKHKEKEDRNKGWDAKRGAVDDKRRGKRVEGSGENALPLGGKEKVRKETNRDDTGVLHPSWLAAKAAKERKAVVKAEGKKIVFD